MKAILKKNDILFYTKNVYKDKLLSCIIIDTNNIMNTSFNTINICDFYNRKNRYECDNIEGYMKHLKKTPNMAEMIGDYNQQIKPVFDVDAYIQDIDIDAVKKDINSIFPDKIINLANREVRITKKGNKYSYRFYVDGVRIKIDNLRKLCFENGLDKNPIYDLSIYTPNRVLFLPLTTEKKDEKVPELKPVDCGIFECCASYIREDFEDWDLKMPEDKPSQKPSLLDTIKDAFINNEDTFNVDKSVKEKQLKNIIEKLSSKRSDDYDTWIRFVWCIMKICEREELSQTRCTKLIHLFSKKSKNYDEDKVDEWIDKNYGKLRDNSYSWTYLYDTCLKEDDPEYYAEINCPTYYKKKQDFELTHAKILHPPMIVQFTKNGTFDTYSIKNCKESYEHVDCKIKKTNKKGDSEWVKTKFIKEWLNDSKIRCYDNIVFKPPPLIVKNNEFNTWLDFKIKNEPLIKEGRDFFQEYCTYLHNLVGDAKTANFILARYASRIQQPAKRTYVCVIYCGCEGDGKNKLLEPIYKIMDKYTTMLDTAKKLYDTHSLYEKDKLIILINEAGGVANFENSDMLKTRITENELNINPKGISPYTIDNMCDYDMTTNNFNVVKLSDDSFRRFLQVETTSYYRGNTDFFNDYHKNIVENPIALRQIYEGLMNFDISSVVPSGNFQTDKPSTEIEKEVKKQNRDKILWFFEDFIKKELFHAPDIKTHKVSNKSLFNSWKEWCLDSNVKVEYTSIQFGIKVSQVMKKQMNKNEVCISKDTNNNTILNIDNCKKFFTALNGTSFGFIEDE